MLALEPHLKARLLALAALAGWAVRTGSELADRSIVPAADVRYSGAGVTDSESAAVTLAPAWTVLLVVKRGEQAAGQLDAAVQAVIGTLHNWYPGQLDSQAWRRMALTGAREVEFAAEGVAGLELMFSSSAVYHGLVLTR